MEKSATLLGAENSARNPTLSLWGRGQHRLKNSIGAALGSLIYKGYRMIEVNFAQKIAPKTPPLCG
jgi:hypothetical protein